MVEVLKAITQNHAPLSQAQTVKVFQYLEDMNKDTMRQIQEFKRTYEMNSTGSGDIKLEMRTLGAQVSTVQQELVKTNTRMSALRVDILGNAANVVVLQEQGAKASEGLNQIREGQKVTNTNVHNLREEHLIAKEEIRKLQKEVASLKQGSENVLQVKLEKVMLSVEQCKEDIEANKKRTYTNEDGCRSLREALSEAKVDIGKLENARGDHEKRMSELNYKGEKMKDNLEMTNGVVMRMHTEHEETRTKAIESQNKHLQGDIALQRLKDDHNHVAQSMRIINEELGKLAAGQDTTRDRLAEAVDRVGGLSSSSVNLQNAFHELSKNVERVHSLASNTEDNLKMTNAMVLPNLGSDGAFGPAMTSSGGGSTVANATAMNSSRGMDMGSSRGSSRTCRSSPRGRGSPRRRKEAAWFSRNIGLVPDRNSWV